MEMAGAVHIGTAVAVGAIESMQNLAENVAVALHLPRWRKLHIEPLDGKVPHSPIHLC